MRGLEELHGTASRRVLFESHGVVAAGGHTALGGKSPADRVPNLCGQNNEPKRLALARPGWVVR